MRKQKAPRRRRFLGVMVAPIALIAVATNALTAKTSEMAAPDEFSASSIAASAPFYSSLGAEGVIPLIPEPELESLGEFDLTAYCPCVKCCGEWSAEHPSRIGTGYVQRTASGTIPAAGRTIGVDTSVIPFGTTVIINGHEYVAEDRGGALKGNKIDIFFACHDKALEFGQQTAEVFIRNNEGD